MAHKPQRVLAQACNKDVLQNKPCQACRTSWGSGIPSPSKQPGKDRTWWYSRCDGDHDTAGHIPWNSWLRAGGKGEGAFTIIFFFLDAVGDLRWGSIEWIVPETTAACDTVVSDSGSAPCLSARWRSWAAMPSSHLSKMSTWVLKTAMCGPAASAMRSISSTVATSAATARLVRLRAISSSSFLPAAF